MKKAKFIALFLALALVFTLAGCGGGAAKSSAASASQPAPAAPATDAPAPAPDAAPDAPPAEEIKGLQSYGAEPRSSFTELSLPLTEEAVTFTYFLAFWPGAFSYLDSYADNSVMKELSARTNVYFDCMSIHPANAAEQFSILFAAEDLPDMMDQGGMNYPGGASKAVEDGDFANIADYLEYMPNYNYLINSDESFSRAAFIKDGVMGNLYEVFNEVIYDYGMIIRGDWLEQLQLEVPTTYDEVYDTLKAFNTELGVAHPYLCLYSLDRPERPFSMGYETFGAVTTRPMYTPQVYVKDGVVKFAPLEQEFCDYLTLLNQWYTEGIIDPDIGNYLMNTDYMEEITTGSSGYVPASSSELQQFNTLLEGNGYFVATPNPVKEVGQKLHMSSAGEIFNSGNYYNISAHCENIPLLLQYIDYMYSEDGSFLCSYGIEGESYNMVDGKIVYTDLMVNHPDGLALSNTLYLYAMEHGPFVVDVHRGDLGYGDYALAAREVWATNVDNSWTYPQGIMFEADAAAEKGTLLADISTLISEYTLQFVVGDRPLSEYPDFVQQIKDMDIDRVLEIYQQAYDAYYA